VENETGQIPAAENTHSQPDADAKARSAEFMKIMAAHRTPPESAVAAKSPAKAAAPISEVKKPQHAAERQGTGPKDNALEASRLPGLAPARQTIPHRPLTAPASPAIYHPIASAPISPRPPHPLERAVKVRCGTLVDEVRVVPAAPGYVKMDVTLHRCSTEEAQRLGEAIMLMPELETLKVDLNVRVSR
jgi:hypothetical protein